MNCTYCMNQRYLTKEEPDTHAIVEERCPVCMGYKMFQKEYENNHHENALRIALDAAKKAMELKQHEKTYWLSSYEKD